MATEETETLDQQHIPTFTSLIAQEKTPSYKNSEAKKPFAPSESRVFAKVCVANLRRSFGDLTNPKTSFTKFDSMTKTASSSTVQQTESSCSSMEISSTDQKQCSSCGKQVFQMELIRAEKKDWHKNCFRCSCCRKVLSVDTYSSNNSKLYCKPHFKELFQPKAVEPSTESVAKPKLQLIICESQPKELPPDVVRASDTPATGLEDISVDVKSKFELFENFKDKPVANEPLPVKRSASVLAKLKKYEDCVEGSDQTGVADQDINGADSIQLQSDDDEEEEDDDPNSVIKSEIKRKLKNPLQALNEIAHFKQMESVRSKWEEGSNTASTTSTDQRKEELQKFRSRLCQGKSNQLKEMYEKALENDTVTVSKEGTAEILKSDRAKQFRDMFEKGQVVKHDDDDEEESQVDNQSGHQNGKNIDFDVFEAGVAKESRSLFEKLDQNFVNQKKQHPNTFVKTSRSSNGFATDLSSSPEVVRCVDKPEEPVKVNTQELSTKFKFFETYEQESAKKALESKNTGLKRITPPREDQVAKSDYETEESYEDPDVVKHGVPEDDTIHKSKTASKMLNIFRQMEENVINNTNPVVIRPLKQFTPPRDTAPRVYTDNSDEEEEDEEEENEDQDEENEEADQTDSPKISSEDDFLKEVGSLARARSLRAKFERWEQQENERNKQSIQEELSESIESARNLKAKFEAMRLMGDGAAPTSPLPLRVNRFVGSSNNSSLISPDFESFNDSMSSNEQCAMCDKRVYAMEKIEAGGKTYHKNCFRCSQCKSILRMDTFTSNKGTLFCTTHFKQLFKIKGNYDEGFGHETQYQVWAKKQAAAQEN